MVLMLHLHTDSRPVSLLLFDQSKGVLFFRESQFDSRITDRFQTFKRLTEIDLIRIHNRVVT